MSFYDYAQGKQRIINILDSKTDIEKSTNIPKSDEEFTYENGIRAWVGALFVDIRNSSEYFTKNKADIVARVIRAFCSEIISILSKNSNYRQIGIRGDCVYAIYSCPTDAELVGIMDDAVLINTFQKMFKKILSKKRFPTFSYGIGLGLSEDLIVKAGKKGTGINDLVWIGNSVVDASNMSSLGNKDGFGPIVVDDCFHYNIKGVAATSNNKYGDWMYKKYSSTLKKDVYSADIIDTEFNKWIEEKL